jgi:hypothetical protein
VSQWLIWPSVENMNSNPEWLMPPMGKQDVSPYDILIDLVPWYVFVSGIVKTGTYSLTGLRYGSFCTSILRNFRSDLS